MRARRLLQLSQLTLATTFPKGATDDQPWNLPRCNELLFVLRLLLHCSLFSSQQLDMRLFKHALPDLRTTWRSRVCARIATRDSVHSSRNAGSCVWCVSKLLQVETARRVKASAVHHGTDRHIHLRSSPSRSSRGCSHWCWEREPARKNDLCWQ